MTQTSAWVAPRKAGLGSSFPSASRSQSDRCRFWPPSILIDVLAELEVVAGGLEGLDVQLLDRQVGAEELIAHGLGQDLVAAQTLERLLQLPGQPLGSDLAALFLGHGVRVDRHRGRQLQPALDSVQAGRDHAAQGDIGVGARVAGFGLDVGRLRLVAPEGGSHAQGALAVVGSPGPISAGPHLRLEPAIGVDRGAGERQQPWQVLHDPRHELAGQGGQTILSALVVEAVDGAGAVPSREMQVASVARLVAPGLGRERGIETVPERHAAHSLPIEDVAVGRLERRRVPDGELLLAPAQLRVVLLHREALQFQGLDDLQDDLGGAVHAVGREAPASIDRLIEVAVLAGQRPLRLECRDQAQVPLGRLLDHSLEEGAAVGGVGLAVEADQVDQDDAGFGRVGCDGEGGRVGDESDLSDRSHPLHGGQVIEHGEGLHRHRQADPGLQPLLQGSHPAGLAPDDAIAVAAEKADELEARGLGPRHDLAPLGGGVARRLGALDRGRHQAFPAVASARRAWLRPIRYTTTATTSETTATPPTIRSQSRFPISATFQDPVSVTQIPTALAMAPTTEARTKTPTGASCSRLNSSGYLDRMIRTSAKSMTMDRHQITVTAACSTM